MLPNRTVTRCQTPPHRCLLQKFSGLVRARRSYTRVYDRLRLGIKPGFTWKNCHVSVGGCLRVRQGLRRIDRWCIGRHAAPPLDGRGGSRSTLQNISFGGRGWLSFLVTIHSMLVRLKPHTWSDVSVTWLTAWSVFGLTWSRLRPVSTACRTTAKRVDLEVVPPNPKPDVCPVSCRPWGSTSSCPRSPLLWRLLSNSVARVPLHSAPTHFASVALCTFRSNTSANSRAWMSRKRFASVTPQRQHLAQSNHSFQLPCCCSTPWLYHQH